MDSGSAPSGRSTAKPPRPPKRESPSSLALLAPWRFLIFRVEPTWSAAFSRFDDLNRHAVHRFGERAFGTRNANAHADLDDETDAVLACRADSDEPRLLAELGAQVVLHLPRNHQATHEVAVYFRTDPRSCSTCSPADARSLPGRCVCSVTIQ